MAASLEEKAQDKKPLVRSSVATVNKNQTSLTLI